MSQLEQEKSLAPAETDAVLQEGLDARQKAIVGNEAAKKLLGMETSPTVTAGGEVLTARDKAEELRIREEQGHAYQR